MLWRLTWAWGPVFNMWMSGPVFARACRKSRKQALAAQFDADVDDFLRENEQLKDKAGECWRYRDISFPQSLKRLSDSQSHPNHFPQAPRRTFWYRGYPFPVLSSNLNRKACCRRATLAMQKARRCRQVPRLPCRMPIDVAKLHACHA